MLHVILGGLFFAECLKLHRQHLSSPECLMFPSRDMPLPPPVTQLNLFLLLIHLEFKVIFVQNNRVLSHAPFFVLLNGNIG